MINYERIAQSVPSLARGQVWCKKCGWTQHVDSAKCMQYGWPKHCGETMTIDSPQERDDSYTATPATIKNRAP